MVLYIVYLLAKWYFFCIEEGRGPLFALLLFLLLNAPSELADLFA